MAKHCVVAVHRAPRNDTELVIASTLCVAIP